MSGCYSGRSKSHTPRSIGIILGCETKYVICAILYGAHELNKSQTVLIIGAGNSAYDIGREIASVAKTVYVSVRSKGDDDVLRTETPWEKVVRSIIPDNLFQVPEISAFCSTRKLHRLQDAQVLLANDARLSGIEFIIFCTGYRYSLPFLPDYQAVHTQKVEDQTKIISDGEQLHNLHKDMIFIEDPTLTFIGVSKEIATFSFFDMQAVAIAAVFAGQVSLPSKQQMRDEYDQRLRDFAMSMTFHQLGLEREIKYIREIVQWVNGSTSPRKLIGYEQTLHEAQQKQLQALRELLISTEILRGKSLEEKQRVIAEKTTQLQQAIAMAD